MNRRPVTAAAAATVVAFALTACNSQSAATSAAHSPAVDKTVAATATTAVHHSAAATRVASPTTVVHSSSPVTKAPAPTTTTAGVQPAAAVRKTVAPTATAPAKVHFNTPEAAMRYLTAAWNSGDMTALKHVTQGTARQELIGMHMEAVNLRLNHCTARPGGDYMCYFDHDYPSWYRGSMGRGKLGHSEFIAAPATNVGWYMFAFEGCG